MPIIQNASPRETGWGVFVSGNEKGLSAALRLGEKILQSMLSFPSDLR